MTGSRKCTITASMMLASMGCFMAMSAPAQAAPLQVALANKTIVCKGGNESSGALYQFRLGAQNIYRVDHRFPSHKVNFSVGRSSRGALAQHWTYETLSENKRSHLMLYERLSMRSPSQSKHIYRTYEIYQQSRKVYMTLYDGVNGARDWKMKTTRDCFIPNSDQVAGNRFWATTLFR